MIDLRSDNFHLVFPLLLLVSSITILCSAPVAATLVLSGVSCIPNPPLVPGQNQEVVATITIIPSGAMTFEKGHEIQMTTPLERARWNVQVIVDGIPAAQQSASGSAAFVNGALISYPTSRDVSLSVTIKGQVPAGAESEVPILQAEELDNGGNIVPGSVIIITQPVTGMRTVTTPPVPVHTPVNTPVTQTSTKTPGFTLLPAMLAVELIAAYGWCALNRNDR